MNAPRLRRDGEAPWRVVVFVVAALCVVAAAVGLLAHAIATSWQWTIVLSSGARYLMWLAAVALVLALVVRRWGVLVLAVLATALGLYVQVPATTAVHAPSGARHVLVMQANLKIGAARPAAIVSLVRDHHVDLLATEELTATERDHLLAAGLGRLLPHDYTQPGVGGSGLGMWSRYPLSATRSVPGFTLGVLTARVHLPGGVTPTFVALHLLPPYPFPPATWRHEIARLPHVLDTVTNSAPVIVAGDFNATVDNQQFRHVLRNGYADATGQAGAGYLRTYPADRWYPPLIGIDHVLTRQAVATSASSVELPGSDHRGLMTTIALEG